jgi:isopenicillin-N epimerase
VNDIVYFGVAGVKVAVTALLAVIVKLQVLVPHAVAALVPAENRPGVPAPGAFAEILTAAFSGTWKLHVSMPPGAPPLLHTWPVGTTPTAPVSGPAMWMVSVTVCAVLSVANVGSNDTVQAISSLAIRAEPAIGILQMKLALDVPTMRPAMHGGNGQMRSFAVVRRASTAIVCNGLQNLYDHDVRGRLTDTDGDFLMWSRRAFMRASGALGAGTLALRAERLAAVAQAGDDEAYWREVRRAFVLDPALVNLNNGNSSPCPQVVHDALKRHLDSSNLLPVHYRGLLEQTFDAVRRQLAGEFGCTPQELAITRNATESLHIAQCGVELRPGDEVVTTDQDYTRMLWAWDQRARRDAIVVRRVQFPVPSEPADLVERFERAITPRTRVFHFCHVTNGTGQLFPVRELSRLARSRGIVTIVDGAQAVAHVPVNLRELECDFYGTSLHKWLMAPHGTGFLYVRQDRIEPTWPLQPALQSVGGDIRKFEEIGTQAAAARAAIPDALAFHQAIGAARKTARLRFLSQRWMTALGAERRIRVLSSVDQSPALGAFTVDGMPAPALVQRLFERDRIIVSAVVNQGLPGPVIDFSAVRVTPNVYTTPEEIDAFVAAVRGALRG